MHEHLHRRPQPAQPSGMRHVLVVDDSKMQRHILATQLAQAGYQVSEAGSAEAALNICREIQPDIILSDWMMSGMSGPEFCRAFRAMPRESYGYFILLTSKSEKEEVALGLQSGADDFLTKPVNGHELRARLQAGERILRMERELTKKNQLLTATLHELSAVHDGIRRDLAEARKLQQSLIRERHRDFGNARITMMLQPSGQVGGDLVGFFPINSRRIGLYGIDVSGHGITSALMTARLASYLSASSPEQNIALSQTDLGLYEGRAPSDLAAVMNRLVFKEMQTETYLTLIYADIDLATGRVNLVQAGHPHPIKQGADGRCEELGDGGLPVGLLEEATYETFSTTLAPGERLILMSDGITEATAPDGSLLLDHGLTLAVEDLKNQRGQDFLDALFTHVQAFAGGPLTDDISMIVFEYNGPPLRVE